MPITSDDDSTLSPTPATLTRTVPEAVLYLAGLVLGRTVAQGRSRVQLAQLDAVLRASAIGHGLITVVAEPTGSLLVDRKAASRARELTKVDLRAFWERVVAESGLDAAPWVPTWREGLRRTGLLIRAGDEAETVIRHAMAVLRTLARTVPLGGPLAEEALAVTTRKRAVRQNVGEPCQRSSGGLRPLRRPRPP
jgi:hypothetical protein